MLKTIKNKFYRKSIVKGLSQKYCKKSKIVQKPLGPVWEFLGLVQHVFQALDWSEQPLYRSGYSGIFNFSSFAFSTHFSSFSISLTSDLTQISVATLKRCQKNKTRVLSSICVMECKGLGKNIDKKLKCKFDSKSFHFLF